jgi:polyphosphate kinase
MARALTDPSLYLNRELSWLAFNDRVLEEAADPGVPLFERLKFASIVASNLDEFFMVRVAGLMRDVENERAEPDLAGLTPAQQLSQVRERPARRWCPARWSTTICCRRSRARASAGWAGRKCRRTSRRGSPCIFARPCCRS